MHAQPQDESQREQKKVAKRWAMYDWANSVYSLIITSTFLPEYYVAITKNDSGNQVRFLGMEVVNTSLYNYALAFAFLVIAFISPFLASLVDLRVNRKKFLMFFLSLGSLACMNLFFFDEGHLSVGIVMIVLSCIGFWGSLVFYNAYLPEVSTVKTVDRVSSLGYKYGYIGSFILQIICLAMVLGYDRLGLPSKSFAVRISFILVGLWWIGFGAYAVYGLPSTHARGEVKIDFWKTMVVSFKSMYAVAQEAMKTIILRKFLLSYLFFNMGIQVVMLVATIYGSKELEIETNYLIITIILIQLLAILGADLAAIVSKKIGNFLTLLLLALMWISVCAFAYVLPKGNVWGFFAIGAYVGLLMGSSQSLNRSTYSKIIPKTIFNTVYFSFYDVIEKISLVIGLVVFAFVEEFTGSMRNSVIFIGIFFVIASYFLLLTYRKSRKQANVMFI